MLQLSMAAVELPLENRAVFPGDFLQQVSAFERVTLGPGVAREGEPAPLVLGQAVDRVEDLLGALPGLRVRRLAEAGAHELGERGQLAPGAFTLDRDEVEVDCSSVEEALDSLCTQFTEIKPNLFDENGIVRNFINVYLNDDDVRYADGMNSAVKDGDSIQIVPSVAGGSVYS